MNTQQNQSQKNEQGKQNLKQPQAGTKQTQSQNRTQEKQQNPTQKHK